MKRYRVDDKFCLPLQNEGDIKYKAKHWRVSFKTFKNKKVFIYLLKVACSKKMTWYVWEKKMKEIRGCKGFDHKV